MEMYGKKRKRISSGTSLSSSLSSSACKVGCNDDLLSEILIRLPVRSVIRSKSVSKHWLSIIASRQFSLQFCKQNHNPNSPSGLFFKRLAKGYKLEYGFVPFDINNPVKAPFKALKFDSDSFVIQSCNGLMLCRGKFFEFKYYVYNPTTKHTFTLPDAGWNPVSVLAVNFVFDPSKSPHYKVVCIRTLNGGYRESEFEAVIDIYNSETRKWKVSGEPFKYERSTIYSDGLYCNEAIHWYDRRSHVWCYKFDEECLHQIQVPPLPDFLKDIYSYPHRYLLESCGILFFIQLSPCSSVFVVYELKKDYSGWFVRYQVDIYQVAKAFPVTVKTQGKFEFGIQAIILGGREEDSFIVLELPGKSIRYNLMSKTFHKLWDLNGEPFDHYYQFHPCLDFTESLSEVS